MLYLLITYPIKCVYEEPIGGDSALIFICHGLDDGFPQRFVHLEPLNVCLFVKTKNKITFAGIVKP
jgi:hypothetical protein